MAKNESLLGIYLAISGAFLLVCGLGAATLLWGYPLRYHHGGVAYLGGESCEGCHEAQYAHWQEQSMAHGFDLLGPGIRRDAKLRAGLDPEADFREDPLCLDCHTTGHGLVGGYLSREETPEMAGVTCEACHGPGGRYVGTGWAPHHAAFDRAALPIGKGFHTPAGESCQACHNGYSPFAPKFEPKHG